MLFVISVLLSTSEPATPVANATPAVNPEDVVKCRRYPVTGYRAKFIKECHTVAEWRKLEEAARNNLADMQTGPRSGDCSNPATGRC